MREKGIRLEEFVDDYVVIDLETTGVRLYDLEIVEVAAVKVKSGKIIAEFSSLVTPGIPIPPDATAVNHISDDMVKDAPAFEEILEIFRKFIGDDILVGHNITSFDSNILYDAFEEFDGYKLNNNLVDTRYLAKKWLPDLPDYKLQTLCNHYGLCTEGEHRALADCYLTDGCYRKLMEEAKSAANEPLVVGSDAEKSKCARFSDSTMRIRELKELILEITKSSSYLQKEKVMMLNGWLLSHPELEGQYPYDDVLEKTEDILLSGSYAREQTEFLRFLKNIVDPVTSDSLHGVLCVN